MTKLYHGPEGQGWQVPGEQDRKAARVDVPNSPGELATWLNERRVPTGPISSAELQLAGDSAADPAAGGAVITEEEIERVNEQRPTFLGRLSAEEIERHRMAANQCPKCGSSESWRRYLVRQQIEQAMETAPLHDIQMIVEKAREIVRERGEQLTGEGRAN